MDIRNLGNFASIEAVWARYPNGGQEGDYLTIAGVKYRWNKYILKWENAEVVTETSGRESTTFSDLHVQNDVIVGGDVKVNGTLRAEHVKQPNVGLFATLAALQAAYPTPEVGMWAVVGNSVPGAVYRCTTEGVWSATGGTGGVDALENVLLYSQQTLNESQKAQARENIGAQEAFSGEATSLYARGEMAVDFRIQAARTNYGNFCLKKGVKYTMTARIDVTVSTYVAVYVRAVGGTSDLYGANIAVGNTSVSATFTPSQDYPNACLSIYSSSYASIGTIHIEISSDDIQKNMIISGVYAGILAKAPNSGSISEYMGKVLNMKYTDIPVSTTAANWKLLPNGNAASDSTAHLLKYNVTEGQIIRLSLLKDTTSVYQFQTAASVPSTNNQNIVGPVVDESAEGIVVVPAGAQILVVSCLKTNTTNKVQLAIPTLDSEISKLLGTHSVAMDFGTGTVGQYAVRLEAYNIIAGHRYSVSITTDNDTDTTYFSTRTDSTHTVDTTLGQGVGSRSFEFLASGDAIYIALSYRYAGTGATYNVSITDMNGISVVSNYLAIKSLEARIGGGIAMPEYSQDEQDRVYDILIQRSMADVHIAAFNTDQHFNLDAAADGIYDPKWVMQGVQAMLNIANLLPIDEIVFGGDVAGYGDTGTSYTPDGIMRTIAYLLQPTHDTNAVVVSIPGNHDAWQNNNQVTAQGMYNVNAKRNQRHTYYKGNGTDNCDAWVDDTEHKIRIIFVDVQSRNVRTEDFRVFLANALATLPEGYMAVCFSHMALTNEFAGVVKAQKISDPSVEIDAFQDPFDCHAILNQYADKIICCINGHTHFDASAVSDSGILYIETTTAAPHTRNYTTDNIPNTSTLGTVTDTSFDFFIIDQTTKTIEAVRYGQGCNRKWIYKGVNAGMMSGYPEQIVR